MKCSYSHFKPDTDNVCIIAGMRTGISHSVVHSCPSSNLRENNENKNIMKRIMVMEKDNRLCWGLSVV